MTDGKPSSQPTSAAPESKPASSHSTPAGAEAKSEPKPTSAEPKQVSEPKSEEKLSKKEEPTQLGSNLKLAPNSVVTDKEQITSAATLQEDRRPGVQYPASSNQLPVDFESKDQETPVQKAEREAAEEVAKLDENNDALVAAATSGDADVHQLLAHRSVAVQNGDAAGVKAVDDKLAERLSI